MSTSIWYRVTVGLPIRRRWDESDRDVRQRKVTFFFLDVLSSKSLDIGGENVESVCIMLSKDFGSIFGHRLEVDDRRRTFDHFGFFRIINFAAYSASKQMTENQDQLVKDDACLGIDISAKLVEISSFEECYMNQSAFRRRYGGMILTMESETGVFRVIQMRDTTGEIHRLSSGTKQLISAKILN